LQIDLTKKEILKLMELKEENDEKLEIFSSMFIDNDNQTFLLLFFRNYTLSCFKILYPTEEDPM